VVSGAAVVRNKAGLFGAYAAGFLNDVFGVVALLCPLAFGALGAACISSAYSLHWLRWCGFFLMTICLLVMAAAWDFSVGDLWGGGMVGNALHHNASRYLSPGGSALLWIFVALMGTQLAGNISWFALTGRLGRWLHARWLAWREKADQEAKTSYRAAEAAPAMPDAAAEGPEDNSFAARLRARLHLPSREFWTGLRDRLGDIRPTADRLPKVYEENGAEGAAPQHAAAANLHGAGQGDAAAPQVAPSSVPQNDHPSPNPKPAGPWGLPRRLRQALRRPRPPQAQRPCPPLRRLPPPQRPRRNLRAAACVQPWRPCWAKRPPSRCPAWICLRLRPKPRPAPPGRTGRRGARRS
jgi:S-DNA-T family DNA segregation ATPase FtsK/SpoIIIE